MEADDAEAICKWRTVCPSLFDECAALGISEYVVLDSLQGIEQGSLASVDEARDQLLRQHALRQKMRTQQIAAAATAAAAAAQCAVADEDGVEDEDVVNDMDDDVGVEEQVTGAEGALPAWVGISEDFNELKAKVQTTLAQHYMPRVAQAVADAVDAAVKVELRQTLDSLEEELLSAAAGKESKDPEVICASIEPLLAPAQAQLAERLAAIVTKQAGSRAVAAAGEDATAKLVECVNDAFAEVAGVLSITISRATPLPAVPPPPLHQPSFVQARPPRPCGPRSLRARPPRRGSQRTLAVSYPRVYRRASSTVSLAPSARVCPRSQ